MSNSNGKNGLLLDRMRKFVAVLTADQVTDHHLLNRYLAGQDHSAFALLVKRHGPMVLGVCWRVLRHRQDAEDAFQATFLVLARKAKTIRQSESLAGWLYRVALRASGKLRLACVRRLNRRQPRCGDASGHLLAEREHARRRKRGIGSRRRLRGLELLAVV